MMSAEAVAKYIASGIRRKKHYLLLDWEGLAVSFIKKISASALDRSFYREMAKEPDNPFKPK
jgi:short-subunit dehydrogenase